MKIALTRTTFILLTGLLFLMSQTDSANAVMSIDLHHLPGFEDESELIPKQKITISDEISGTVLEEAIRALEAKNPYEAIKKANAYILDNADSAVGYEVKGGALLNAGNLKEAQKALMKAVELDPSRAFAKALLEYIDSTSKDPITPAQFEEVAREAIKKDPASTKPRKQLIGVLLQQQKFIEAEQQALELVELTKGSDAIAHFLLAGIYYESQRLEEADISADKALARQSDLLEAQVLKGIIALDLNKYQEAFTILKKVLERDSEVPWARLGMAKIWLIDGDLNHARKELERLLQEHPQWAIAHFRLGEVLLYEQDVDGALAAFDAAISAVPIPQLVKLKVAGVLLDTANIDKALTYLDEVGDGFNDSLQARQLFVRAHQLNGNSDLAVQQLQDAVAAEPNSSEWLVELGRFYLRLNRGSEALLKFQEASKKTPDSIGFRLAQVDAYIKLGEKNKAVSIIEAIKEQQQNSIESRILDGWLHEQFKQWIQAESVYQSILDENAEYVEAIRGLARAMTQNGQAAQAIDFLRVETEKVPIRHILWFDLAQLYDEQKNTARAKNIYERILKEEPYNVVSLNNLAFSLAQYDGKTSEALELAQKAHRLMPHHPSVMDTLGWIYYLKGDFNNAEKFINLAVQINPDQAQSRYHRGMVYLKQNRNALAKVDLNKALEDPTFKESRSARKALQSL